MAVTHDQILSEGYAADRGRARLQELLERYGAALALSLLGLATAMLMAQPLARLFLQIPITYNEGWNAFHAARALSDEPLYLPMTAFIANNYPPLSFYITGSLGALFGDQIIAGRAVALISLLIVAINIALLVGRMGGTRLVAAFAGLLFVGYMAAHHSNYVGMNDPQMLAHAFMTTGFVLFLRSGQRGAQLVAAVALMLASGLIKHNLLPLPLAITAWLFIHDSRGFQLWVMAAMGLLAVSLAALYLVYGAAFFEALLTTPRAYSVGAVAYGFDLLIPMLPLLGAALVLAILDGSNREMQLIISFALVAGLWGLFVLGGEGVVSNALFDFIIGVILAAALAIDRLSARAPDGATKLLVRNTAMLVLMLTVLVPLPVRAVEIKKFFINLDRARAEVVADIAFIAEHGSPVACETLALCYWAGKEDVIDFFLTGQKLFRGRLPMTELSEKLEGRCFSLVQIANPYGAGMPIAGGVEVSSFRLPPEINATLADTYRIERVSDQSGFFLVPDHEGARRDAGVCGDGSGGK